MFAHFLSILTCHVDIEKNQIGLVGRMLPSFHKSPEPTRLNRYILSDLAIHTLQAGFGNEAIERAARTVCKQHYLEVEI
jgi:hypothetical protein